MDNEIKKKVFFLSIGGYISVINKHLSESYPLEPLGKHIKVLGGYAFKSAEYKEEGIPIIRISDFNDEKIDLSSVKYYDESPECDKYELKEGEIIIALTGGTIGKLGIVQKGLGKLYLNQRVGKFEVLKPAEFFDRYVYWIARGVQDRVKNLGYGGAQPNISGKQIESIEFPIPKKEEQIGIVNFLKDLRDGNIQDKEYFNKETEKEIIKLQKIQEDVFTRTQNLNLQSEDIQKLRQSILSEAVQGKLVPQDPNDEPASVLLEKIKKEKERLIKEKKIKKEKPLPPIIEEEKPFAIPSTWTWAYLNECVSVLGDGIHGTPVYSSDGDYYFINGNNLSEGEIIIKDNTKKVTKEEAEKHYRPLNNRTVLVSINGTIGNIGFYRGEKVMLGKSACFFNLFNEIDMDYIKYLIKTNYFLDYALSSATGTTIKNVSLKAMRFLKVPLPPLPEQARIVQKVDQLMKLCDELEEKVKENQKNSELLMEAVLREAFEAG